MNNRNLKNLINLYGGNNSINEYTSSLLEKYNNLPNNDMVIIKLKNLEILLDQDESEDFFDNITFPRISDNEIIKIDQLNNYNTENSETFSEIISNIIK